MVWRRLKVVIPAKIAGYVRKKVAGGGYRNSEAVVCEALRRMAAGEPEAKRAVFRGDALEAGLSEGQRESIRAALELAKAVGAKGSRVYDVSPGVRELSNDVAARGRRKLASGKALAAAGDRCDLVVLGDASFRGLR